MEKEPCTKFCGVLDRSHEVIKLLKLIHTRECTKYFIAVLFFVFFFAIFIIFTDKKPHIKCYGVFDHFSTTYIVAKF